MSINRKRTTKHKPSFRLQDVSPEFMALVKEGQAKKQARIERRERTRQAQEARMIREAMGQSELRRTHKPGRADRTAMSTHKRHQRKHGICRSLSRSEIEALGYNVA